MACDLAPTCNFLFGYFSCTLLEDTLDFGNTTYVEGHPYLQEILDHASFKV